MGTFGDMIDGARNALGPRSVGAGATLGELDASAYNPSKSWAGAQALGGWYAGTALGVLEFLLDPLMEMTDEAFHER
ncbi:hypothetical protein NKI51_29010 [Mesorhizobium australicum]|uniref:hypothetical protein n=1 Tax=Mesorhizobium australicum TaxID=536018 RepID=UPI003339ABD8